MLTSKWETLEQIRRRTGEDVNAVVETVREMFWAGKAQLRFDTSDITEKNFWRRRTEGEE